MATPFLIIIALVGAAALGFLSAWHYQHIRYSAVKAQCAEIKNELQNLQSAFNELATKNEAQQISIGNYQKLLESLEQQNQELEHELLMALQVKKEQLKPGPQQPIEPIREIEVIREVPVLVFRDHGPKALTKEEKAAKLLKAFKKGIEIEGKKSGS